MAGGGGYIYIYTLNQEIGISKNKERDIKKSYFPTINVV